MMRSGNVDCEKVEFGDFEKGEFDCRAFGWSTPIHFALM